eukprot:2016433-Rhodomonas_salina.1
MMSRSVLIVAVALASVAVGSCFQLSAQPCMQLRVRNPFLARKPVQFLCPLARDVARHCRSRFLRMVFRQPRISSAQFQTRSNFGTCLQESAFIIIVFRVILASGSPQMCSARASQFMGSPTLALAPARMAERRGITGVSMGLFGLGWGELA